MRMFIFGYGYSSVATARHLRALIPDAAIEGTARQPAGDAVGVALHRFDGGAAGESIAAALRGATHVLASIPPGAEGDPGLVRHRDDLDAAQDLQWLGYFSTVGVYGDAAGGWVDERTPVAPRHERAQARVAAEQAWHDYAGKRGVPLAILRLAGIYGPGRSAFDKLRAGTARRVIKPGQVFNRIHVEDIGRITALAARSRLDGVFNLADGDPAPPQDVVSHAAALLGVTPPPEEPFETAGLSGMAQSFYADTRRVDGRKVLAALGIGLLYPSYRDGLAGILAAERR